MPTGRELIEIERERQKRVEGFTDDHDDDHDAGDLARAAQCYENAASDSRNRHSTPYGFPWAAQWWKPKDRLSNLVRAGALYQAELDRLNRRISHVAFLIDQELRSPTIETKE